MSDTLKIMVRTEEVREVSTEFRCVVCAFASAHTTPTGIDARALLHEQGYVQGSLGWDDRTHKWTAKFHVLREATLDERDAWYLSHISAMSPLHKAQYIDGESPFLTLIRNRESLMNAKEMLKDKEIVLEVVKGGDAHDN